MEQLEEAIRDAQARLRDLGYKPAGVSAADLDVYLQGETTTGDVTSREEVLGNRFLLAHEIAEISELKRRRVAIDAETLLHHGTEAREAHLVAAELEVALALVEGDTAWLRRRLGDARVWVADPHLSPEQRERHRALVAKMERGLCEGDG